MIQQISKRLEFFRQERGQKIFALVLSTILLFFSILLLVLGTTRTPQTKELVTVFTYEQVGQYDFRVFLKPNTLFEDEQIGSRTLYYSNLVDMLVVDYTYLFEAKQPIEEAEYTYYVYALIGEADIWQKKIELVPPTTGSGEELDFSVVIPIQQIMDLFELFSRETGAQTEGGIAALTVVVIPEVTNDSRIVSEIFEHQIDIQLSDTIIQPSGEFLLTQPGELEVLQTIPGSSTETLRTQRILGTIGILLSLIVLGYLANLYRIEWRRATQDQRDFQYAKRRLGGLFVQTDALKPVGENEETIYLTSLRDLVNLADETLRPVLYQIDAQGKIKFVILRLGYVRYEYLSKDKLEAQD